MTNETVNNLPTVTDEELALLADALSCLYYQVAIRSTGAARARSMAIARLADHIGVAIEGDE